MFLLIFIFDIDIIGRFLLSTHYTHYDFLTFMINLSSLLVVLIAKLPLMQKARLFGSERVD